VTVRFYRAGSQAGRLRPNTLIGAAAGAYTCVLSDDREAYVLTLNDPAVTLKDQRAFMPFLEQELSATDGHDWRKIMTDFAHRAAGARLDAADLQRLKVVHVTSCGVASHNGLP